MYYSFITQTLPFVFAFRVGTQRSNSHQESSSQPLDFWVIPCKDEMGLKWGLDETFIGTFNFLSLLHPGALTKMLRLCPINPSHKGFEYTTLVKSGLQWKMILILNRHCHFKQ